MSNSIDRELLLQRIMQVAPRDSHVVAGSTPIVSFGNLYTSQVATIGINPSVDEFMTRHNPRKILSADSKRFVDLEFLGLDESKGLTREQAELVLESNFNYFKTNPYAWFDRMEKYLLNPIGASYFDGSAAHLDLVQWATDPVWNSIKDAKVRDNLISNDKQFLLDILKNSDYKEILLNGSTVVKTVSSLGLFELKEVGKITYGRNSSRVFVGRFGDTRVRATSLNIPAAHGLEGPQKFSKWLSEGALS